MLFAILDEIIDFDPNEKERCDGCKDCRTVYCNGGFQFYGCYHKPYRGKWVKDIKHCPKEQPVEEV